VPQTFYYFNAYAQLLRQGVKKVISRTKRKLCNIARVYWLGKWFTGEKFIAATNANDTVPEFLKPVFISQNHL